MLPQVNTHIGRMAENSSTGKAMGHVIVKSSANGDGSSLYGAGRALGTEFENPTWLPGGGARRRRV